MKYFTDILAGIKSTRKGLSLTLVHILQARHRRKNNNVANSNYFNEQNGLVTLQYPAEKLPVPDIGRYQLANEIDDCIVCDKCAKVCPVDCIEIEPIKAVEDLGHTSDGTPKKIHAAVFNIDMAKCCFCGLCTTVCPTECLTMSKEYDFSTFDITDMNFKYSDMTLEVADEKRKLLAQFQAEKEALKASAAAQKPASVPSTEETQNKENEAPKPKMVFKPVIKKP